MTSNLGSHEILNSENYEVAEKSVKEILKNYFRPEFLNRVDDIIVFKALAKDQVKAIAEILLKNLSDRLEKQIKIKLTWSDKAIDALADQGFDPNFGARPLRRFLSHTVETSLSKLIIAGNIKENETVQIDYDGNIYINGEILEEHYGAEVIKDPGRAAEPVTLGEDEYFVMGDNREVSKDSRMLGGFKRKEIIGKVNVTLNYFDPGYVSARRTEDLKERCFTFDKYEKLKKRMTSLDSRIKVESIE